MSETAQGGGNRLPSGIEVRAKKEKGGGVYYDSQPIQKREGMQLLPPAKSIREMSCGKSQ